MINDQLTYRSHYTPYNCNKAAYCIYFVSNQTKVVFLYWESQLAAADLFLKFKTELDL